MSLKQFQAGAASETCRRIDFENVELRPGIVNGTFFLVVTGKTPCINMKVSLIPLIYIKCPEYWGIEVVGCLPNGICLTAIGSFTEFIPLAGVTGSVGIEVIGATKTEQIAVDGGNCSSSEAFRTT
jgi:hypothetical protein